MSRIFLGGTGEPIPIEALPDPVTGDLPPIRLLLDASGFTKTDFVSLGYTHWECWCIGALGGDGGGESNQVQFTGVNSLEAMSSGDWTLWLELIRTVDFFTAGEWDHVYSFGPNPEDQRTAVQQEEFINPGHNLRVTTYSAPVLLGGSFITANGGAGGGGGLHHTSGLLSALSTLTPVVVGAAGADGAPGQSTVNGLWTPMPDTIFLFDVSGPPSTERRMHELYNYFNPLQYRYPTPVSFNVPQVGSDGGYSTFGTTLCRASGGKGGGASVTWPGGVKTYTAAGGAGGKGNQTTAGGGGAGSTSGANGADGTWDGVIGKGGGGGRGGHPPSVGSSSGGQGSYSFADTSVYGNRGIRELFVPGGGGGAKIGTFKFGGAAVSWLPQGAVILRLTKIV